MEIDDSDHSSDTDSVSVASTSMLKRNIKGRLTSIQGFVDWNPKNCDKLRIEPNGGSLESEHEQLVWLWKSIEINLDEPLMLRQFIIPLNKGGVPHPVLPDWEEYLTEANEDRKIQERLSNLRIEIQFGEEDLQEKTLRMKQAQELLQTESTEEEIVVTGKKKKTVISKPSDNKEDLLKHYEVCKQERKRASNELERLHDKLNTFESHIWKIAKKCVQIDKKALANFKLAYNALGEHITKLIQTLGSKVKIRNILEDGSLHSGRNPLIHGLWREIYENIIERLYPNSVEMMIVLVNDLLTDSQKEGETYECFFHRMNERARVLQERSITTMTWRELASITALTKGKKEIMHGYLASERQLRLAQRENALINSHLGVKLDPSKDRERWAARMADYVTTLSEGTKNEKKLQVKKEGANVQSAQRTTPVAMTAESDEKKKSEGSKGIHKDVCYWHFRGNCKNGDKCKFKHVNLVPAPQAEPKGTSNNGYISLSSESKEKAITWDSAASKHYCSVDQAPPVFNMDFQDKVTGIGGSACVIGKFDGTNLHINGDINVVEGIPKSTILMSLGEQNQINEFGDEGVTILKGKIGVRAHVSSDIAMELEDIIKKIEDKGQVEGRAILAPNNVYEELQPFVVDDQNAEAYDIGDVFEVMTSGSYLAIEVKSSFENTAMLSKASGTKYYNRRIKLDSPEEYVRLMSDCGMSRAVLVNGVRNKAIQGIPSTITEEIINDFFHNSGPDLITEMTKMVTTALDTNLASQHTIIPGHTVIIDAIDPPFSREPEIRSRVVKSLAGYRDSVVAMDEGTGYISILGRQKKEDPHLVVDTIMDMWHTKKNSLRVVKTDDEFLLQDDVELLDGSKVMFRQAPPYDHRRVLNTIEGANRWLQDTAQLAMNRLYELVLQKWLTDHQWAKLWYHALLYAVRIWNLGEAHNNPSYTRYEMWHGCKPNLQELIFLPFGTLVVTRRGVVGSFGRGCPGIYVGPSPTVPGGILIYNPKSGHIMKTGSFVPRDYFPLSSDYSVGNVVEKYYGILAIDSSTVTAAASEGDGIEVQGDVEDDVCYVITDHSIPPKPLLPRNRRKALQTEEAWKAALARETRKLIEAGTFKEIKEKQAYGKMLVKLKLLPVMEYKWKECPTTGKERWVECIRLVANGSYDKRDNVRYAITPNRIVILTIININCILGLVEITSDAVRAYLQAKPITDDIVIQIPSYVREGTDLPEEAVLGTALYGTTDAALAFEIFAESKLSECGFQPLEIAQSIYVKQVDGKLLKIIRHSDDFHMSGVEPDNRNILVNEMQKLSELIKMTPPQPMRKFLGLEITKYNSKGIIDMDGGIVVLHMRSKVIELYNKFSYLCNQYNAKGRYRKLPAPQDNTRDLGEDDEMSQVLDEDDHKVFRSLVGGLLWIANGYRWDTKYACFVLTLRMHKPRRWDMFLAVWLLEYIYNTRDVPLVLGGSEVRIHVYSDASFATLPEARSPKGHLLKLNEISGAIFAEVHSISIAVKSIFEAELIACSEGFDTAQFIINVLEELGINRNVTPKVKTDSEAVIAWIKGKNVSVKSKHLKPKFYGTRHVIQDGVVDLEYIPGVENPADILTKILPLKDHLKHLRTIMGHALIDFDCDGVTQVYMNEISNEED